MKDKNLILIDANNFFFRAYLTPKLTTNGQPIEVVYSIFKNLINVIEDIRKFTNINKDVIAFCDDGGYDMRMDLSKDAVNNRIIPMTYKSKRRIKRRLEKINMTDEEREEEERKFIQIDLFYELLNFTRINQIKLKGVEADDVISSYVNKYSNEYNVFIVSNDKDYYQLLDNAIIYNSRDSVFITKDKFKEEFELNSSEQWVDMGSIMGDNSDTIYGVDGIGKVGALKIIKQYGNIENIFQSLKDKADENLLNEIEKYKSWQDFNDNIKQTIWNKTDLKLLFSEKRVKVAKILKKMIDNLNLPDLINNKSESLYVEREFERLQFKSIMSKIDLLVYRELDESQKQNIMKYFKVKSNIKQLYFCNSCNKEFMAETLVKCPICNSDISKKENNNIVQASLFD